MNIYISLMIVLPAIAAVIGLMFLRREYDRFMKQNKLKKTEDKNARIKYGVLACLPVLNVLFGLVIALIINSYFTGAEISKNVGLPCGVLAGSLSVSTLAAAFIGKRGVKTGVLTEENSFRKTVLTTIGLEFVIIVGLFFLTGWILGVI